MDCERFDDSVMDALYGELDELSAEALKRHVDACARCSSQWEKFKATRAAIQLPVVEPSDGLTDRILEAEGRALRRLPFHRKVVRAAAWAGSHAMRPQLAMAALFMFVIGSSMMLLRARPGSVSPPVTVRDEGRPLSEEADERRRGAEHDALQADEYDAPRAAKPQRADGKSLEYAAPEAKSGGAASARALAEATSTPLEAEDQDAGGKGDAQEGLARGLSLKGSGNCEEAVATLKAVEQQYPGSKEAERAKAERIATKCTAGGDQGNDGGTPNAAPTPTPQATATATDTTP